MNTFTVRIHANADMRTFTVSVHLLYADLTLKTIFRKFVLLIQYLNEINH